jgi:dTDP-glucose 4,6-dehydratase
LVDKKRILITGGTGFIGLHVFRSFLNNYPYYQIYNLDALTYAVNLQNLSDIEGYENYTFLHGDISDETYINNIFIQYNFAIP